MVNWEAPDAIIDAIEETTWAPTAPDARGQSRFG
jgi:hypothetical protein